MCRSRVLRVHHEPLVLLFGIVLLQLLGCLPVNVIPCHCAQVGTTIGLHNHQVTGLDGKTSALLDIEDVGTRALEENDVERLVATRS